MFLVFVASPPCVFSIMTPHVVCEEGVPQRVEVGDTGVCPVYQETWTLTALAVGTGLALLGPMRSSSVKIVTEHSRRLVR